VQAKYSFIESYAPGLGTTQAYDQLLIDDPEELAALQRLGMAPFIRLTVEGQEGRKPALIAEDGMFGLLPAFATEMQYGRRTYNARSAARAVTLFVEQQFATATRGRASGGAEQTVASGQRRVGLLRAPSVSPPEDGTALRRHSSDHEARQV
jgi:hypothetical protein